MRFDSWLDRIVFNIQDHWETSPQYRAAVSGIAGLLLLVAMCSCTGVISALSSSALASVGVGNGGGRTASQGGGSLTTGTNPLTGAKQFAIPTVVWTPGAVPPASPLPNSQTPAPTPTLAPTPTDTPTPLPCTANCGGGGGGGYSVKVTAYIVPSNPLKGLASATIHIHTSIPNDNVGFLLTTDTNGTYTGEVQPSYATDGSGDFQLTFTVPNCTTSATINVFADGSAPYGTPGYSFSVPCH